MTTNQSSLIQDELLAIGLAGEAAATLSEAILTHRANSDLQIGWDRICRELLNPDQPFAVHKRAHELLFAKWDEASGPAPVWSPSEESIKHTNLGSLMRECGIGNYDELYKWSITERFSFWEKMIKQLGICFDKEPEKIVGDDNEIETPVWLPGAKLNIADSCFEMDSGRTAIVYASDDGAIKKVPVGELFALTNRVANGLVELGLKPGDAVAVDMLMTVESVAIYLGIIKAGCVVVSIADSFAPQEIATRLRIANAKAIFTQDFISRGGKQLPLYEKVVEADALKAIVLPAADILSIVLRDCDLHWSDFLSDNESFDSISCQPHDPCNILFSSGTTGEPKAIPWTHTTPIKCAADGWLHHDIKPGDVVAWPTNLGWMMGPWLIYASLINKATIALYEGAPNTQGFCKFVQDAKVTMLGVVPSLVSAWRTNDLINGLDWSSIRAFSSTGECSNADDMFWLMSRAGYKPIIEYCGGTEIGGGYITGTMVQPASPATFSTPALGLGLVILDEQGEQAEAGELFLIGPSIGLSNELLNLDHHEVYFKGTPTGPNGELLRRHGDEIRRLAGEYFQAQGRADDTMNLGGIKTSSAEIERVLNGMPGVTETAAITVTPEGGGPERLVIFAVIKDGASSDPGQLQIAMQESIKQRLNPLFRIFEVRCIDTLPRTASNKVMRRTLRAKYSK
ncbi:MAG: AMP-binding protein [Planctomycetes bacterium]|nr:AMP-binding protein [Planctomycetota bacterium]